MFFIILTGILILVYAIDSLANLNKYLAQRNYIKAEMNRSRSQKEYEHWKKRLIRLRLRQIPIIGLFIK